MTNLPRLFAASLLAAPGPLQAQQLGGGGGVEVPVLRIFAALLVAAGAALAVALILRNRGGTVRLHGFKWLEGVIRPGRIQLVETRRIGTQAELSLVRCDDNEYLILSGPGGTQVLEQRKVEPQPVGEPE